MNRSEIRKIGGSTISGILGLSPWSSPHGVYLELTGEATPKADNEIFERGRKLEPVVAAMFAANHEEFDVLGLEEVTGEIIIEHEDYPFLIGSPDRILSKRLSMGCENCYPQEPRSDSGLEIKTADISKMSEWGNEDWEGVLLPPYYLPPFPLPYWLQCQWYMGLLGMPDWYLAVGFVKPGSRKIIGYKEYHIEHDPIRFAAMKQAAIDFWENHVMPRVPPEITDADPATVTYYKSRYPQHTPDSWAYSDESLDAVASELLEVKAAKKEIVQREDLLELKLKAAIGEKEGIITASGKFTHKTTKSTEKTDWKAVAIDAGAEEELIKIHTTEKPGHRMFLPPRTKGAKV
jgi:putative phage-type endonuclease